MRIVSGKFRGYPLLYPTDHSFRPTQEKVRDAICNALSDRLQGAVVLDLCCGTGAMAFEAMSRGAKSAMLIDIAPQFAHRNRDAIFGRLKGNEQSEFLKNVTIYRNTIDRGLAKLPIQPDIIFLDPPYDKQGIYDDALQAISQFGILSPTGVLVVEFSRRIPVSTTLFQLKSQYTYSGVRVGMYVPHP